jgi:hypothetical protein
MPRLFQLLPAVALTSSSTLHLKSRPSYKSKRIITAVTNGTGTSESERGGRSGSIVFGVRRRREPQRHRHRHRQFLQEPVLNTPEYQSIAQWLPNGSSSSFITADKERFSDEIIPKHFRVALFHSFVRKHNRYGFRRVKSHCNGEESSFAHNNFVRDKPWLCLKMNCKSKPIYHKDSWAVSEAVNRLSDAARITVPSYFPPSFLIPAAGGIV